MALKVWLPLNGNLENKGISSLSLSATPTFVTGGKTGEKCLNSQVGWFAVPEMAGKKQMSFAYWVKINAETTTNWLDTFSWYTTNGSSAHRGRQEFYYFSNGAGKTGCWYYNNSNSGFDITVGSWDHYAFTIDFSTGISNFYKNGVLLKTTTNIDTTYYVRGTGNSFLLRESTLDCSINDFRLYDHILSAKEVKEISQGLVLHYKLDGFSGGVGENILTGTNYNSYSSSLNATTATNASGKWCGGSGGNGTFSVIEDCTCPVGNLSWNISNNTSGNRDFQQGNQPYVSGQQYTTSFWAKGNGTCLYRSWNSTDGKQMFSKTWTLTSDWVYYTHTFTASAEMETDLCTFHLGVTGNSNISICGMKMEKGSIATAWSPAPQDLGIDTTKITDSSGYGNDGFLVNGANEVMGVNNGRYQVCTSLLGTTVDNSSNTIVGAQYLYAPFKMPAWNAITIAWWGNNIAYGRGGIFETTGTTGNIWEGSDYNTTAIANWDSTFGIYNGSTRINIFNNFVKDSTWHYHTITFDGTNVKYYCDSILKQTSALTGTLPAITGFKMGLGRAGGVYRQIKQKLNDLRIYATALSAEDILDLYHISANIDNLGGIHGFEMIEDTSSRELLALPWTSAYGTHNKTSISTNYNDKKEWYSNVSSSSAGSDYIKINPTGKTYYYDTEISVATGNQFYIGFERYDANKTSRSNNACVYIVSIKPTTDIVHQRYFGTVNLATDGVNPTDTIALRILNAWSGTTSDSTKEATIHYLSLREVTGKPQAGKIKQQGQIHTDEFVEREKQASIYENGFVGGNIIIEK